MLLHISFYGETKDDLGQQTKWSVVLKKQKKDFEDLLIKQGRVALKEVFNARIPLCGCFEKKGQELFFKTKEEEDLRVSCIKEVLAKD